MKHKLIIALLALAPMASKAQTQKTTDAPFVKTCSKTNFLPVLKKGYRPQIGVALLGGIQNNNTPVDKSTSVYGAEVSLQCPLLCAGRNYIRQQLSIVESNGSVFHSTDIELNPHYRILVTRNMELSAGPGFGLNMMEVRTTPITVFTYGLSGSFQYYFGHMFVGVEPRYMLTPTVTVTAPEGMLYHGDLSNTKILIKAGIKF
jgi:hypothetical protein